ncbi:unnamed protein product, partial [Polarella glacialis]
MPDAARRFLIYARDAAPVVEPADINSGKPNRIRTTRFTIFTWLPLSLFNQFQRAANIYFLFVSIAVCLPGSPIMWSSTVFPFCCVLFWTALKDLYEDTRRKRDDDAENLGASMRYDFESKEFVPVRWMDILCGDILLTFPDQAFPADVMLVRASGGQAFISTVNLDGETNLKERRPADLLSGLSDLEEAGADVTGSAVNEEVVKHLAAQTAELLRVEGLKAELDVPKAVLTDMDGSLTLQTMSEKASAKLTSLQ